jgi:uncharacterized protein YbcI
VPLQVWVELRLRSTGLSSLCIDFVLEPRAYGITVTNKQLELEQEISRAFVRFEKEYMGRGPVETKTYFLDDMILVRLRDVMTASEKKLSQSGTDRSRYLLKQVRNELLSAGRPLLEALVQDIVGVSVQSVHTDISTKTGERIIVFTLCSPPDCDLGLEDASWSRLSPCGQQA